MLTLVAIGRIVVVVVVEVVGEVAASTACCPWLFVFAWFRVHASSADSVQSIG